MTSLRGRIIRHALVDMAVGGQPAGHNSTQGVPNQATVVPMGCRCGHDAAPPSTRNSQGIGQSKVPGVKGGPMPGMVPWIVSTPFSLEPLPGVTGPTSTQAPTACNYEQEGIAPGGPAGVSVPGPGGGETKPGMGVAAGECLPWPVLARRGFAFPARVGGGWKKRMGSHLGLQSGGRAIARPSLTRPARRKNSGRSRDRLALAAARSPTLRVGRPARHPRLGESTSVGRLARRTRLGESGYGPADAEARRSLTLPARLEAGLGANRRCGHAGGRRAGAHPRRPPGDRLGSGWPEGGRGAPGDEALHVVQEDDEARYLPARIAPHGAQAPPGRHLAGDTSPTLSIRSRPVRSTSPS